MIIGTLTNFPVFISFTDANLKPTNAVPPGYVNPNTFDIVFATADHAPVLLPHERTTYDPATGAITAWVLIPSLSATTNEIYVYYGNTSITTSQSNPSAVWGPTGANYQGVWHLDETLPCSTTFADATGNGLAGTCVNAPPPVAGRINGARSFSALVQQGIAIPSFTIPITFTFEAWVSPSTFGGFQAIMDNEVNNGYNRWLGINGNNFHWFDGSPILGTPANVPSGFRHIAVTSDFRFYVDGAPSSLTARSYTPQTGPFAIGYAPVGTNSNIDFFNGIIDEVRISPFARNQDWIQTSYNNQLNPGAFITVGLRQQLSVPNTGTVRTSEIDFDWVSGQSSWGQVIWSTTESEGDVRLRVYYTSNPGVSPPCDVLIPSSLIPDNALAESGLDISRSPLTISTLTPSIYNRLCLEATLTRGATISPILNDWRITWQAPGVFNGDRVQSGYRWYQNANALTPGAPIAAQNVPATSLMNDQTFRLRLMMHVNNQDLLTGAENYRLQFAPKVGPTCGLNMTMTDEVYSNVTNTTAIAFADNSDSTAVNGTALSSMASDPQHDPDDTGPLPPHTRKYQSYQELGTVTFTNGQSAILQGEDGVWDFVLRDLSAPSRARYCFRMVRDTGASLVPLNGYAIVSEVMAGTSYVTSGAYISNRFAASARAWNVLEWRQTDVSASCPLCRIRLQIQTSTNGSSWQSGWCGPNGICTSNLCTGAPTDFYTDPSGTLIPTLHNTHRWIRYKACFDGGGNVTPILEEVRINYQQ